MARTPNAAWQPIATAPRNVPVLLFDQYYLVRVGRWQPRVLAEIAGVSLPEGVEGLWVTDLPYGEERGEIGKELEPTYWAAIPLPLPVERDE